MGLLLFNNRYFYIIMSRTFANIFNLIILIGIHIPAYIITNHVQDTCPVIKKDPSATAQSVLEAHMAEGISGLFTMDFLCSSFHLSPWLYVHAVYFIVVDVGFYLVYLAQGSTWAIDPSWQTLPALMAAFYYTHPHTQPATLRGTLSLSLLLLWAVRLLHNYFRREEWNVGEREDWRYADMRKSHGRWWIVTQFFAVSVAQHGMLVGLTLPLLPAMQSREPLHVVDVLACALCVAGILIGFFADNQLFAYMAQPREKRALVLRTGLWGISRHPNHLGEQTWWIGLLLFSVAADGMWWPACFGVLFNHTMDTFVTLHLIEDRMLRRKERVNQFRRYQRQVSICFPFNWFIGLLTGKKQD